MQVSTIYPSGNIWLLSGVPLDKTYQNTIYFPIDTMGNVAGRALQRSYFLSSDFIIATFSDQMYTRHTAGVVRVAIEADSILNANYMVFQNENFGNQKLFYAFVTKVEYVNNNVSNVYFELDVLQTWYFDYRLCPTFVERTHAISDTIGSHLEPEPVDVGEHTYSWVVKETVTSLLYILIAVIDTAGQATAGKMYGNIYGGARLFAYKPDDVDGVNSKIAEYIISPDSIVSIYMCPQCLISATVPDGGVELAESDIYTGFRSITYALPETDETKFGSFTPHNNKLYTYPYTYFEVFTPEGSNARYRYEYFDNNTPTFEFGGSVVTPVTLTCIPTNYKFQNPDTASTAKYEIMNESVSLRNYPLCSWNNDTFKAWVAQSTVPIAVGFAGQAVGVAASMLTGNVITAGSIAGNLIGNVVNTAVRGWQASIAADRLHGQSAGSANVTTNVQGFFFARSVVNEASARLIDSFFDRFGYAVNKIQEPERKNRKYFTYIKTLGCTIHGTIPADDEEVICRIHDNGITYWDASEISTSEFEIGDFHCSPFNTPLL